MVVCLDVDVGHENGFRVEPAVHSLNEQSFWDLGQDLLEHSVVVLRDDGVGSLVPQHGALQVAELFLALGVAGKDKNLKLVDGKRGHFESEL